MTQAPNPHQLIWRVAALGPPGCPPKASAPLTGSGQRTTEPFPASRTYGRMSNVCRTTVMWCVTVSGSVMPDPRPLREDEPKRVGSYRLTGYLGGGSQGAVYCGTSPSGQTVAVKVLHRWLVGDNAARRRFVEEMSVACGVAEFGIARVLDVGFDLDVPYIVSEYVPGESLHAVVTRHGPR